MLCENYKCMMFSVTSILNPFQYTSSKEWNDFLLLLFYLCYSIYILRKPHIFRVIKKKTRFLAKKKSSGSYQGKYVNIMTPQNLLKIFTFFCYTEGIFTFFN